MKANITENGNTCIPPGTAVPGDRGGIRGRRTLIERLVVIPVLAMLMMASVFGGTPLRVMPLGDSITQGTPIPGGYRAPLYELLTHAGFDVDFVGNQTDNGVASLPDSNHEGHPGYFISQIDTNWPTWISTIADPDVILLLIGTNDYGWNQPAGEINRLDQLISDIAASRPLARLIVANLLLRTDNASVDQAIQTDFNPYVPGIVSQHQALGQRVFFTDLRSAVGASDLYDGVHPNQSGYNKMAANWFTAITNAITPGVLDFNASLPAVSLNNQAVPAFYQPVPRVNVSFTNAGLFNGGSDHTTGLAGGSRYNAYQMNGAATPLVCMFDTPMAIPSVWLTTSDGGNNGHSLNVTVKAYSDTAGSNLLANLTVPTGVHPAGSNYVWTQFTGLTNLGLNVKRLEFQSEGNAQVDDLSATPVVTNCDLLAMNWGTNKATINGNNVTFLLPFGTSVTSLNPTYTISDFATGSPAPGSANNFTNPVDYTVTALDGIHSKTYHVTVYVAPPPGSIYAVPPQLNPGDLYRLVFVTSTETYGWAGATAGAFANIGQYNAFATTTATAVPALNALGTTWNAIVSVRNPNTSTVDARSNTGTGSGTGVPFFNLAGQLVAMNNADFWDGTLAAPINMTELGSGPSAQQGGLYTVWTGMGYDSSGTGGGSGYSLINPDGGYILCGLATATDSTWGSTLADSIAPNLRKNDPQPIYVMSGVLTVPTNSGPSSACNLLTFNWGSNNATINGNAVTLTVPYGTPVASLNPTCTASPYASIVPASGSTGNFTNPVSYTVTAQDGIHSNVYQVTVTVAAASSAKQVISFAIGAATGVINETNKTIAVQVPYGTSIGSLTPTIGVSPNASVSPASGVATNFTSPVNYTVTAQDNSTQNYVVTVTLASNTNLVQNGGFEDPATRSIFYTALSNQPPTHWVALSNSEPQLFQTKSGSYGENQVETAQIPPTYTGWLPANTNGGVWAFMLQGWGGGAQYNGTKQDLGTITAGTTYAVSADFARNTGGAAMNYDFFLMDGTANTALAGIDELAGGVPAVGSWVNKNFSYTATSGVAGHELWIVLRARVPASDVTRGGIDNVVVTATAGVTTTSFATWAALNSASTDASADSNNNGVPNGIEFFMGASPGNPAKLPSLVGANGSWTWTIPYDPQAAASYKFQISGDLSPTGWTDVVPPDARIHVTPPLVPATLGSVQLTLPAGAGREFCRLVVTPAP